MNLQTILRAGFVVIGAAFAGQVVAQTANNPPRAVPNTSQAVAAAPNGPVLRRQPRAAGTPSTAATSANASFEREPPEDAALNRMISGICRGC